ncbi:MAG: ion transporter [Candidatus Sumerlaeia bacterium]|nr:ion transporter [Candidatus Sumerlaeia bacterium]
MRDFVYGRFFGNFIVAVIIFNALLIGLETYYYHPVIDILEWICVWIFVVEIILKYTYARTRREYFRDGWNWFDIIVVGAAFVPQVSGFSTALRILRVLRVLRLIKVIPEMRLIVSVLAKSLTSMTYIAALMSIVFYVFAVIGHHLFGDVQMEYASLHESMFTLFRVLTLESWTAIRYAAIEHDMYWSSTIFHVVWVLVSTFVMLNLIVGAIINNYAEVQQIEKHRKSKADISDERLEQLVHEMNELLAIRRGKKELEKDAANLDPPFDDGPLRS